MIFWGISDYKPKSVIQVEGPLLLLDQLVLGRDVVSERVLASVTTQVLHGFKYTYSTHTYTITSTVTTTIYMLSPACTLQLDSIFIVLRVVVVVFLTLLTTNIEVLNKLSWYLSSCPSRCRECPGGHQATFASK